METIDKFFSQTEIIEINGKKYVKKRYTKELGIVKWFIIKSLSIPVNMYPFVFNPRERLCREVSFFDYMKDRVFVPRVVETNYEKLYIVREYIEGKILDVTSNENLWKNVGRTLGKIHVEGYSLGDSKITNFLLSENNRIYIIDAEQAIPSDQENHRLWDIVVFLSTMTYKSIMTMITSTTTMANELDTKIKDLLVFYGETAGMDILDKLRKDVKTKILIHMLIPFPYNIRIMKMLDEILIH